MIYKILFIYFLVIPFAMAVEKIEVQALFSGKAVVMVDGKRHTLSVDKPSPEGVKMISADSKSAVLEVNGQQKRYMLGNTISMSFAKRKTVKEQIIANKYGMFMTYGSINGRSVEFLVDTGATTVAMSAVDAKKLGIPYRIEGKPTRTSTASGVAKGWQVMLKSVTVGKIKKKKIRAIVIDGSHPREVLLGMTFLDGLKVEKNGKKMILEQKK
jgi:aspartyl protease family protein